MRKRKRYESASQIEALIDKTRKAQYDNMVHCEGLKATAAKIYKWMDGQRAKWDSLNASQREHFRNEHARALFAKEEADKCDKRHPVYERRLRRLKATLAALQTDTFQFVEDKSVTLQKVGL